MTQHRSACGHAATALCFRAPSTTLPVPRRTRHHLAKAVGMAFALLLLGLPGFAQQPSQAQIGAIRRACRGDYMAHCSSVPTGGRAALECLVRHESQLSPSCHDAVAAIAPAPAKAPARPSGSAGGRPAPRSEARATSRPEAQAAASWPHSITTEDATAILYEPQVIDWPGRTQLEARLAVQITPAGKPAFVGTIVARGETQTDLGTRIVTFSHPELVSSHFPSLDTGRAAHVETRIREVLAGLESRQIPLDTILLGLAGSGPPAAGIEAANPVPRIFVSDRPAVLLAFDGEPVMVPIKGSALRYAVNANWLVLQSPDHSWWLLTGRSWSVAGDPHGPWHAATAAPPGAASLPAGTSFAPAREAARAPSTVPPPQVFVATGPAEIIVTDGPPVLQPIAGTSLSFVANTASDLFRAKDGTFYYLVSGRWFAATSLDGPWHFATTELPPDFLRIPPSSPRGRVLVSVPGAEAAQLAAIQAQVPHQATLARQGPTIKVSYVGAPVFVPIAGTSLTRAVNSPYGVIRAAGRYYVCWQGAWFVAATPAGPWVLASAVPAVIYTIPPASPLYPVTYVRVYAATPTAITYGYTSGYSLGFVSSGVVVYGTGYAYPPTVIPAPVPVYFPYPATYSGGYAYNTTTGAWVHGGSVATPYGGASGFNAYNPATGAHATGGSVYGPYGGAGGVHAYNPTTGAYANAGAAYGPYGGAAGFNAYNPSTGSYAHGSSSWGAYGGSANGSFYNARTGVSGTTSQNSNAYGHWGSSVVSGPNQTVNTASGGNARGSAAGFSSTSGAQGAAVHGAYGNTGGAVRTANGDVYAGANGHAYQHSPSGWSQWSNGGWQPVQASKPAGNTSGASSSVGTTSRGSMGGGSMGGGTPRGSTYSGGTASGGGQHQYGSGGSYGASASHGASGSYGSGGTRQAAGQSLGQSGSQPWGQLNHDRQARLQGARGSWGQRFGGQGGAGHGGAAQGRFGGARSGGGERFSGGGRFGGGGFGGRFGR